MMHAEVAFTTTRDSRPPPLPPLPCLFFQTVVWALSAYNLPEYQVWGKQVIHHKKEVWDGISPLFF